MRFLVVAILTLFLAACATNSPSSVGVQKIEGASLPAIGDLLPDDAEASSDPATPIPPKLDGLNSFVITRGGVAFTIGADSDGVIHYVGTSDPAFSTPDGVNTEMRMVDMIRGGQASSTVEINPDQSTSMLLGSGWWAAVPANIGVDTKVSQVFLK